MNVTSQFYVSFNETFLSYGTQFISKSVSGVSLFGVSLLRGLVINLLGSALIVAEDVAKLCLVLLSFATLLLIVSFFKCLEPRYILSTIPCQEKQDTTLADPPNDHGSSKLSDTIHKFNSEYQHLQKVYGSALTSQCIQSIFNNISWYHTRGDIETVQWFNQSLTTLWPSCKTLIYGTLLRQSERKWTSKTTRKLTKRRTKLSILISCRRKLNYLKRHVTRNFMTSYNKLSFYHLVVAVVNVVTVVIVYFKQFIVDFLTQRFSNSDKYQKVTKKEINLRELVPKNIISHRYPKSWAGWTSKHQSSDITRVRQFKSAPPNNAHFKGRNKLFWNIKDQWLRKKRFTLAKFIESLSSKQDSVKPILLNRLKLGRSCPIISGIKFSHDINSNQINRSRGDRVSNDRNMLFITELIFASDDDFSVKLSSLPLIDRLEVKAIKIKLRLAITFNHMPIKFTDRLDLYNFDEQGGLPKINYIQLSLIEAPLLDWSFRVQMRNQMGTCGGKRRKLILFNRIISPRVIVRILNHQYFKYICHSFIYFLLKWMKPFDIKIGPHLYFKSIS